jgi:hypothetical protein
MSQLIDTTQTYRLTERLLLKDDGQDVLAFDPESLSVHQFNSSLARVAKMCDGTSSCEQLVVDFADRYTMDMSDAAREVYRALKILHGEGLLETE